MAGDNEMDEILNDEAEQPTAQQYEGDDIGALATAKQRMAERDAEYSAAFAKAAEKPEDKPAAKRSAKPRSKPAAKAEAKATKEVPAFAEDAPAVERKAERKPDMTAPIAKAIEQKFRKVAADNAGAGDAKFADVKGGLRGLKGGTEIPADDPKKDRAEYLAAWKDD
jgi:hypothetical protein